jgi:predicted ATPase
MRVDRSAPQGSVGDTLCCSVKARRADRFRPRGLVASGKFDQYKRNMLYATLAQAFQTLVRQVLAKGKSVKTMPSGRSNTVECGVGASGA